MSLFNKLKNKRNTTTNHVGAKAYDHSAEYRLVSMLLTSFVQNSYYRSANEGANEMLELVKEVDPRFAAKAAIYARNEFGMRSSSHLLAAALSARASGTDWGRNFYDRIVRRPDDMLEITSAFRLVSDKNKNLTNAMKKGFAAAFDRFDGYQLAKYRAANKGVKLVDLVNLVRPVPTQRNAKALQQLVEGTLRNTDTWEAKLSQAGTQVQGEDKEQEKTAAWSELIREGKLGYMALLRNLRNLLQANLTAEDFGRVIDLLTNERAILKSMQFPFRFLSAYAEVEKLLTAKEINFEAEDNDRVRQTLTALEAAVNVSVQNLPLLAGKTVILTDNSGSMGGDAGGSSAVSAMSKRTTANIANLFAVLFRQRCENTYVGLFGDRLIHGDLDRAKGVFENFKTLNTQAGKCGPGTEAGIFEAFENLIKQKEMVARIVIFSDMQIGDKCNWFDTKGRHGSDFMKLYKKYRAINPDVRLYSIDLRGYGTTVFANGEYKIAGWSDKIFEIMDRCEQDPQALLNAVRAVEL